MVRERYPSQKNKITFDKNIITNIRSIKEKL